MDGHQYEHECAKMLRNKGFSKVQVTKGAVTKELTLSHTAVEKSMAYSANTIHPLLETMRYKKRLQEQGIIIVTLQLL